MRLKVLTSEDPVENDMSALSDQITSDVMKVLEPISGVTDVKVTSLNRSSDETLASLLVHLQPSRTAKDLTSSSSSDLSASSVFGSGSSPEQQSNMERRLSETVSTGRIGSLRVNPQYLFIRQSRDLGKVEAEGAISQQEWDNEKVKVYIILAVVVALIALALIQAACTVARNSHKAAKHSRVYYSAKESLMSGPAWQMNGHTNYGYETFERHSKSPPSSSTMVAHHHQLLDGGSHYHGKQEHARGPLSPVDDPMPVTPPRASKVNGGTAGRVNGAGSPPPPDFYFMPSQRKYSGEVVRVYVDYNKK